MTLENKLEEIIIGHCQYAWKLERLYFEERKLVLDYIENELAKMEHIEGEGADRKHSRLEIAKKKLGR